MISLTKMLLGREHSGDRLRYRRGTNSAGAADGTGPVVVWNCTRACNLFCRHCYASATPHAMGGELSTGEAKDFLDTLAAFNVPALLLSGGEPLLRSDIFELLEYARTLGLRTALSTNGTLIDERTAARIMELGVSYAGISLDGSRAVNDAFRGVDGAFDRTIAGFRNCRKEGQKAGLRLSMTRSTLKELPVIFRLVEDEGIARVCLYHLVPSGRGAELSNEEPSPEEKRAALDFLAEKTLDFAARGVETEILTVDNHCDGIYLYLREKERGGDRASEMLELLTASGGNRSGVAIGAVDWEGDVHIDQFTQEIILGNVRERDFPEIWRGESDSFLHRLRDRKRHLRGRCRTCGWLEQCNGNLRARALAAGDFWGPDPSCYLTDDEIAHGGTLC